MMARKRTRPVQFNVRIAAELRDSLNRAAKQNGVSLNIETAKRLGGSFAEEKAFGGEAGRRLLFFIAAAFVFAGERFYRDHISPRQKTPPGELDVSLWIEEPEVHSAAMMNVIEQWMLHHQPGVTLEKCLLQVEDLKGRIATHFLQKKQARP